MENNTRYAGKYDFTVFAKDCVGNTANKTGFFLIKPMCDVDIIKLVTPDPTVWHNEMPTQVTAVIKNNGVLPVDGPVNVHLQIYKEETQPLVTYKCWDMESCVLSGMWDIVNWDDGPAWDSWMWTEKRANSPTHSWHSQPDAISNYEGDARDSLILSNNSNGIDIPAADEYGKPTYAVYLNFSQFVDGEGYGGDGVDYGMVYLRYYDSGWTNWYKVGGPYINSDGEWEDIGIDITNISGNNIIGKPIQVNWTWYSDTTLNREGWYIDDVCIKIQYGNPQPLVYQEYKYVYDLEQNESKEITFPLNFTPDPDTWYFFEIYSDLQCCQDGADCYGDVDGPKDNEGVWADDERTGYKYWDPYNGVNHSLYFGDVCDAGILSITADDRVELDHEVGYVDIPITVVVENTGTLAKEIPVTVSARHKMLETPLNDDVESGDIGYATGDFGTAGENLWHIDDFDYVSPTHAWHWMDGTHHYGAGQEAYLFPPQDNINWNDYVGTGKPFDEILKMKWNLAKGSGEDDTDVAVPIMLIGNTVNFFLRLSQHLNGTSPWTDVSMTDLLQGYIDEKGVDNIVEVAKWYVEAGGDTWPDDFHGFGIGTTVEAFGDTVGLSTGTWSGVIIDDWKAVSAYPGAEVWSETNTTELLQPGENATLEYTWHATEYCDYILTAEVELGCDVVESNNEKSTMTRIYEVLYNNTYEAMDFEDNTCGGTDNWHLVDECSLCPDNQFWWDGNDDTGLYEPNANDALYIDHTFNMTGADAVYLNFSQYYAIEEDYDYGYVEVSNDSGEHWFIISYKAEARTGLSTEDKQPAWEDTSYLLEVGSILYSEYTDIAFSIPSTFFTDSMQFRFRFYSDEFEQWKGWYIDDVNLTLQNSTGTYYLFADDMEDTASTMENWTHSRMCFGNHWHNESTFGDGTDAPWLWNGEAKNWSVMGQVKALDISDFSGCVWNYPPGTPADLIDPLELEYVAGDGYILDFSGYLLLGVGEDKPDEDWYVNIPISVPDLSSVKLSAVILFMTEWCDQWLTTFGGAGLWAEVTNSTGTYPVPWSFAWSHDNTGVGYIHDLADYYDNGGPWGVGSWWGWNYDFDLTEWAGEDVTFSFHMNATIGRSLPTWWSGTVLIGNVNSYTFLPGSHSIPYHEYYNNVDEKVIFTYDLTHAYEAILEFDQNYSFNTSDVGQVEISTDGGETWQVIQVNKETSGGWIHTVLDISKFAGGDVPVQIRYRFISDGEGTDYGWMIDNFYIEGKVDYKVPSATATLSPAEPQCNGWYNSDVTVTLTAEDNYEVGIIYYSIDGGTWLTYTGPISIGIDGQHTVEYYAVDSVGNEGAHGSVTFKIDKTAPTGSLSVPQAGYIYFFGRELMPRILVKDKALIIGGLTATATASDSTSGVAYVTFSTGAGTGEDAVSPYEYNLPFYFFGADTLTVSVTDNACNTANIGSVDYFKIF